MSSGVTPCLRPPSVIAGFVETGVRMPIRSASRAIFFVPDRDADRGEDGVVGERQRAIAERRERRRTSPRSC